MDWFRRVFGYPYTGIASFETGEKRVLTREANAALYNIAREFPWPVLKEPGGLVVDLACGNGWASYLLSSHKRVVAIDIKPPVVATICPHVGKGIDRLVADGRSLPFRSESVEAIFMNAGYHHFADGLGVLNEWHRVLKPGGRLVAAGETPTRSKSPEEKAARLAALRAAGHDDEYGYTASELALTFDRCHFGSIEYVKIKYQEGMAYMGPDRLIVEGEGWDNGLILGIK